jgi:hypothetical protein
MEYNEKNDCYDLTLHSTVVVKVFKTKYVVNCGGWWTNLTRKKIREWSGVQLNGDYYRRYIENEFVYYNGKIASVYYPRMEVSLDGEPLKPVGAHAYKLRKGVTGEFTDVAKRVRQALLPRAMMGEFEQMDGRAYDGYELFKLMKEVGAKSGGLFPEFMSTDELAPLFIQRPRSVFGRRSYAHSYSYSDADPVRTGVQCLESNLAAAKREWLKSYPHDQIYETVEKPFDDR